MILRIGVEDDPSLAYVERCQRLSQEHIPNDWDGVYTLTTKELITEGSAVVW